MVVDTKSLIWEEKYVMDYLHARRGQRVKTWTVVNEVSRGLDKANYRKLRSKIVPLLCRMMKEKKIIRHRKSDTLRISEVYV